jgi:uncharacterized OB-fold protein
VTLNPDSQWLKPLPQPDNVSRRYWAAAARGELLIQECPDCGERQFYPRALCASCGGEPEWLTASGRGVVHTFTVIRQYGMPPFVDELPYVVAMVELEEGPMIMGNVTGGSVDDVHIGMAVEAHFTKVDDDIGIPYWKPVGVGGQSAKR